MDRAQGGLDSEFVPDFFGYFTGQEGDEAMSEQGIQDLWDAIGELREQQGLTNTYLAEIKAILGERCQSRGGVIAELKEQVRDQNRRIESESLRVDSVSNKMNWFMGILSGALAVSQFLGIYFRNAG